MPKVRGWRGVLASACGTAEKAVTLSVGARSGHTSSSGIIFTMCCVQTVVIDGRAHMLGRLASIVAKQILAGQQIVSSPRSSYTPMYSCMSALFP